MADYNAETLPVALTLVSVRVDGNRAYEPLTPIIGGAVKYPLPPHNKGKKRP